MRKQIFATATMRRPIRTENDQAAHKANCRAYAEAGRTEKVNHDIIVELSMRIAERHKRATQLCMWLGDCEGHKNLSLEQEALEKLIAKIGDDICQLCTEMQRACRGETGPFPSDSWSHLNEG